MKTYNHSRRNMVKKAMYATAAFTGAGVTASYAKEDEPKKPVKEVNRVDRGADGQQPPLFSGAVKHGNTLYIAGLGAHFDGDIKDHTAHVLETMKERLEENGSSMEKALKVSVFLHDLNDYDAMNEVFRGKFGENPPVRTTVATYGGVPGDSLVEMDVIAALD